MESLRRRHYRPSSAQEAGQQQQQTPLVAVPIIETPIGMKRTSFNPTDYQATAVPSADAYPDPGNQNLTFPH